MTGEHAGLEGVRQFYLGDILRITTGRLALLGHMDGIYDILNYMTGDNLLTDQLPRAADECAPSLKAQHPDLGEIVVPENLHDEEAVAKWLGGLVIQHGESRPVLPLHPDGHIHINPIEELADKVGVKKIFVFDPTAAKQEE